jgi:hypothetical protein
VMPVDVDAQGYERRFRPENVDPFASYVYFRETRAVAVILIARWGWTSRVAAMAVAPEARGRGAGEWIMQRAIRDAVARGARSMLLKVFEHNTPAVDLYKGLGFSPMRRLVGYHREPGGTAPGATDTLSELDPLDFARVVPRADRRNGWGTRLMLALYAAYPERAWSIPQIVPEDLAPAFFARCGLELLDTDQLEMVLDLPRRSEGDTNG